MEEYLKELYGDVQEPETETLMQEPDAEPAAQETEPAAETREIDPEVAMRGIKKNRRTVLTNIAVQTAIMLTAAVMSELVMGKDGYAWLSSFFGMELGAPLVLLLFVLYWLCNCVPSIVFHSITLCSSFKKCGKLLAVIDGVLTAFGYADIVIGAGLMVLGGLFLPLAFYVLSIGFGQIAMNMQIGGREKPKK